MKGARELENHGSRRLRCGDDLGHAALGQGCSPWAVIVEGRKGRQLMLVGLGSKGRGMLVGAPGCTRLPLVGRWLDKACAVIMARGCCCRSAAGGGRRLYWW